MGAEPKRAWWRTRRWRTAAAVWMLLPVAMLLGYLLAGGPAFYAFHRGWVSRETFFAWYGPLDDAADVIPPLKRAYPAYLRWWVSDAARPRITPSAPPSSH